MVEVSRRSVLVSNATAAPNVVHRASNLNQIRVEIRVITPDQVEEHELLAVLDRAVADSKTRIREYTDS